MIDIIYYTLLFFLLREGYIELSHKQRQWINRILLFPLIAPAIIVISINFKIRQYNITWHYKMGKPLLAKYFYRCFGLSVNWL